MTRPKKLEMAASGRTANEIVSEALLDFLRRSEWVRDGWGPDSRKEPRHG